jgi:hypothetical protein
MAITQSIPRRLLCVTILATQRGPGSTIPVHCAMTISCLLMQEFKTC